MATNQPFPFSMPSWKRPLMVYKEDDVLYIDLPKRLAGNIKKQVDQVKLALEEKDIPYISTKGKTRRRIYIKMEGYGQFKCRPKSFLSYALDQWLTTKAA